MDIIAAAQITIVDLNDPIQQGTAPENPVEDMLWLDTSESPALLKRWNGTEWVTVNDTSDLKDAVDTAQEAAQKAQEGLEIYKTQNATVITQLETDISLRVEQTSYNARNEVVDARLSTIEADTDSIETSVQNLQQGIGTHFIVETDKVRITQDQSGNWEQHLYADRLAFVNKETGGVAASFGIEGGYADRLRSNETLSVGTTTKGWYDMTVLPSGVADKWRNGTETALKAIITEEPIDCLLEYISGTHSPEGTTAWPESMTFSVSAKNASSYQWQECNGPTSGWKRCALDGHSTATLGPVSVNASLIGKKYRCVIIGADSTALPSREVRVRYPDGPAVFVQPSAFTAVSAGDTVQLSLIAIAATGYQWQTKSASDGAWSSIAGETGTTLSFTAASGTTYYRCMVSDSSGRQCPSDESMVIAT